MPDNWLSLVTEFLPLIRLNPVWWGVGPMAHSLNTEELNDRSKCSENVAGSGYRLIIIGLECRQTSANLL